MKDEKMVCPAAQKCGGCRYQGLSYPEQLHKKQRAAEKQLRPFGTVSPIIGMENPYHYRNKVHAVFGKDRRGNNICGTFEANTHRIVPVEECLIEDEASFAVIRTVRDLLKSFKIQTYEEDTGRGFLRHALVRRGFESGQMMLILVVADAAFPSKHNFVKALRQIHPELTTIIQNINRKNTSMVLGDRSIVLYGKGYIEDTLCGRVFVISPKSFYQINPVQTKVLYETAVSFAGLTGKERVLDAYCGIGTIGLVAAGRAREVTGVELNADAIRDARINARKNHLENVRFYAADAGRFLVSMAERRAFVDVVFMDPPRAGSDQAFLSSVCRLSPKKIVYISCNPETLARDLCYLTKHGYQVQKMQPVDMFCWTEHTEIVCLLSNRKSKPYPANKNESGKFEKRTKKKTKLSVDK